jgi:glycerate kinase
VNASFALLDETAVVESAQACGLARLPGGELAPLTATSRGAGELILAAVRMRAKRIVLGLGGVACTDGGAGLVTALGGRLLDSSGNELPPGGAALATLDRVDVRCSTCSRSPATCPEHAWSSPGRRPRRADAAREGARRGRARGRRGRRPRQIGHRGPL